MRPRSDSNRDLLEELEDGWATPAAPHVKKKGETPAPSPAAAAAATGGAAVPAALDSDRIRELEAAAERVEAESARMQAADPSEPNLADVDEGWLDDLFPEEEEEDAEDELEEPEPDLPD